MNDAPALKQGNQNNNSNSDNDDDNNLLDLLGDSNDDGGVVNGAEESFDFNPPDAVVATKGFDAEFRTEDAAASSKVIAQPP